MNIECFYYERVLPVAGLNTVADFLHIELEQYGDSREAIMKAINYAMDSPASKGGLVAVMSDKDEIIAAAVINRTGMEDYIPENILVYIAVRRENRGQGLGKLLLYTVFERIKGDIALHVEPENPAIGLYQSMGFKKKYVEMRLQREEG